MIRHKTSKCKYLTPDLAMASCSQSKASSRSVVKFYNSIPDYEELNHLDEIEFYSQLGTLRDTYSRIKYGSDTTLSSDASKTSDDSVETVKERRISAKRISMQTKETGKENREPTGVDRLEDFEKYFDSNAVKSSEKASRRAKSASPTRRSSLKGCSKVGLGPKCKSLNRYESPDCDVMPKIKGKKKRTGYIPLTSRIPIYDQIVEDQKQRSEIRKLESAIELQSKIKPFHFSTTRSRSRCSSASVLPPELHSKKEKSVKTSTATKKQNSNYFNSKKWEEDYFRRISRMIRAEELLKLSTPSPTAKKETPRPKSNGSCRFCTRKRNRKKTTAKQKDQAKVKILVENNQEMVSPENDDYDQNLTPLPIYPVARPNLAAKLRAEVARKRTQKLTENTQPKTKPSTYMDWGVRKTPAWKSLAYSETNDEDISFRVATRRAELGQRQREHALNMELMRERVRAAPLLLEGTTFWSHRVGKASHSCGKECRSSLPKSDKKRIKSAGSSRCEVKFVKKKTSSSASCMLAPRNIDSDDLESEDRAYL